MKKAAFLLGLALFISSAPITAFPAISSQPIEYKKEKIEIKGIGGHVPFTVEIADTEARREHGYMHRKSIPDNTGMLFLMERDQDVAMWMKDTPLPLDMLFIDKHGQIVYIKHSASPNSTDVIRANRPVRAVLELAGGTAAAKNIHLLDSIISPRFKP